MKPSLLVLLVAVVAACGDGGGTGGDAGAPAADAFIPDPVGQFPAGFLWGTAVAPYQVEGNLHGTDWYQWEGKCATCSGDSADDGPAFLKLHPADFANAKAISNNAVRIGLDWSRVFPSAASFPDSPDPEAVKIYHDMITAARAEGLTVMVTLIHFALPIWIQDLDDLTNKKGWEDAAIVDKVAAWAGWAAKEYGADVDYWITINEPFVNVVGGWIGGEVPPGKSFAIDDGLIAGENMIRAHARAYDAIHANDLTDADADTVAALVSIAKHNRVFLPKDPDNPDQVRAATTLRYVLNDYFLQALVFGNLDRNYDFDYDDANDVSGDPSLLGRLDFIGLNYYGVTLVVETANDNNFPLIGIPLFNDLERQGLDGPMSDFGWTIYPQGMRQVLDELTQYALPIIITENGIADAADTMRPRFLIDHLYAINKAIDDGIDVRGYFHWSLIDNFEWGSGYCPRFGLFRVDFDKPERTRTMGEGAEVYRRIIDDNTVKPELFATYPAYGAPGYCPRVGL